MPIQYLPYEQIDKAKWDACIDAAANGSIYAGSFYLDTMAKHWDALVLDEYAAVMPLTWNKKYGVCYLYQPFFTASLGLFGNAVTPSLLLDFFNAIPVKFRYLDIYLNRNNRFQLPGYNLYERMNYVLPLNESYEKIYAGFRDNIKRNLKKSIQLNCVIKKDIAIDSIITLARQQPEGGASIAQEDYTNFKKVYQYFYQRNKAVSYGTYTPAGQLVASAAFLFSHGRAYYILVGNHPDTKIFGASHALINAFIKEHAEQALLLDFEGSDINGVAFFYSSFGAREEKFAGLKLNRLPFWMKRFKK